MVSASDVVRGATSRSDVQLIEGAALRGQDRVIAMIVTGRRKEADLIVVIGKAYLKVGAEVLEEINLSLRGEK